MKLVFFNLFIKYLKLGVTSKITKSVDDIKLLKKVRSRSNCKGLSGRIFPNEKGK